MAGESKSFGADVRAAEAPVGADLSSRRAARGAPPSFFETRGLAALLGMRGFFSPKHRTANNPPLFSADALASLYTVGAGDKSEVSFGFLLRQSVHALERGRALIDARGAEIARVVAARASSEAMLAAWGARLFIALFWVFVGVVLAREAGFGLAVRGLDAASAAMLGRVFVAAGVLGAVAAFVGGFLVRASERSVSDDSSFGAEAGRVARDFGEAARQLETRIKDGDGGASDISRLHLVAVEAASFLEGISFLTEPDHARADEKFAAFLARHAPPAGSGGSALILLALGVLIGAVAAAGGLPRFAASGLPPWAIIALPGLAFLYAGLGLVFSLAGASSAGSAAARARREILTRLRKSYAGAGAPRADELISGIEAAIARPSGHRSDTAAADSTAAGFAWARPPEPPRFVAQSFDAAPPVFRPEKQASLRKNFFGGGDRNAAPKQTASAPDAPPWLKD